MKLLLHGHDYKYAVEQILLALFPEERPEYISAPPCSEATGKILSIKHKKPPVPDGSDGFSAVSVLSFGDVFAQSVTTIKRGGQTSRGIARVRRNKLTGKLVTDRVLQRIIKTSFYKAAKFFMDRPPVWGSLTGIRPAQIASAALASGKSEKSVTQLLTHDYYVSPERAKLCVDAALSALALKRLLSPPDVALYIGIPFCPSRCAYCSFVSNSVEKSFGLIDPFVQTIQREIEAAAELIKHLGLNVIAVYIGGGTPTALPPESLKTVLQTLGNSLDLARVREYTVEAGRPDTITAQKLDVIKSAGVKRVCVNPQSMSQDVLDAIGRNHTPEDVLDAVRLVRKYNLALNMDIIAGLPADIVSGFMSTLNTVLSLNPGNITVHTLSLKKGSRIMLEGTSVPSGAEVAEMLKYAAERLRDSGFSPYYLYRQKFTSGGFENTGWSLPGHEGIYNICMMEELCSVIGIGGGAVTKLVSDDGRIERIFNAKYPREYVLKADPSQSDGIANKFERIKGFYS